MCVWASLQTCCYSVVSNECICLNASSVDAALCRCQIRLFAIHILQIRWWYTSRCMPCYTRKSQYMAMCFEWYRIVLQRTRANEHILSIRFACHCFFFDHEHHRRCCCCLFFSCIHEESLKRLRTIVFLEECKRKKGYHFFPSLIYNAVKQPQLIRCSNGKNCISKCISRRSTRLYIEAIPFSRYRSSYIMYSICICMYGCVRHILFILLWFEWNGRIKMVKS